MYFPFKAPWGAYYSARKLKKLGARLGGCGIMVERTVKIGRGVSLFGPCIVSGKTELKSDSRVLAFSRVEDSVIGRGASVSSSTVVCSEVGENSAVGPYAYLRGGAKVGKDCRVGDFVEIKNSSLGNGSKVAHHAYIGDADVGIGVNIGCGVVFANYDGKVKARTTVGDHCFIGCNCNIVAPVHIGGGAYIAAGTTVTQNVAERELCIGRARQSAIKDGAEGRYKNG